MGQPTPESSSADSPNQPPTPRAAQTNATASNSPVRILTSERPRLVKAAVGSTTTPIPESARWNITCWTHAKSGCPLGGMSTDHLPRLVMLPGQHAPGIADEQLVDHRPRDPDLLEVVYEVPQDVSVSEAPVADQVLLGAHILAQK